MNLPPTSPPKPPPAPFKREDLFVLLGLVATWAGSAWATHWLFNMHWGWSLALGPVLLVCGYLYLLGTTGTASQNAEKLQSIFRRRPPPS